MGEKRIRIETMEEVEAIQIRDAARTLNARRKTRDAKSVTV